MYQYTSAFRVCLLFSSLNPCQQAVASSTAEGFSCCMLTSRDHRCTGQTVTLFGAPRLSGGGIGVNLVPFLFLRTSSQLPLTLASVSIPLSCRLYRCRPPPTLPTCKVTYTHLNSACHDQNGSSSRYDICSCRLWRYPCSWSWILLIPLLGHVSNIPAQGPKAYRPATSVCGLSRQVQLRIRLAD